MRAEGDEEFIAPDMMKDNNSRRNTEIGFNNPVYANKIRSEKPFATCSLMIGTQQTELFADAIILYQASYFHAFLTKSNMFGPIYLPDLDPDAVNVLIDYLYTGTITYTDCQDSLQNILMAAKKFGLEEIRITCLEILTKNLAIHNCLQIRAFAKRNNFPILWDAACEFVQDNFIALTNSTEFVNLEDSDVAEMISTCNRNLTTDEVIFRAILRWVKHDESRRVGHIYGLLTHVNLVGLFDNSPELVMNSFKSENVLQGKPCQKMYSDMTESLALKFVLQKQRMRDSETQNSSTHVFENSGPRPSEPTEANLNIQNSVNFPQTQKRSRLGRSTSSCEPMETEEPNSSSQSPGRRAKASSSGTQNSPKNINGTENENEATPTPSCGRHFQTDNMGRRVTRCSNRAQTTNGTPVKERTHKVPTSPRFGKRTQTSPSSESPKRRTKASPRESENINGNENEATPSCSRHLQTDSEGRRVTRCSYRTKTANSTPGKERTPEVLMSPTIRKRIQASPKTTPPPIKAPNESSKLTPSAEGLTSQISHLKDALPLEHHKITGKTLAYLIKHEDNNYLDGYTFEFGSTDVLGDVKLPRRLGSLAYHEEKIFHIGGTLTITDLPDGKDFSEPCKLVKLYQKGFRTAMDGFDNLELLDAKKDIGVCVCGDYLYTTGGCVGTNSINGVERLQLNQRLVQSKWKEMERSMECTRSGHGIAVLDGKIYVFGGLGLKVPVSEGDISVDLRTAECFNPSYITPGDDQPDWKLIAEMNHERVFAMSGVMNNKIYAIGGSIACFSMYFRAKLRSVEYYDPIYNRWTLCAPMTTCRSGGAVVVQDHLMYVIGGDKSSDLSMEVYDHRINKWMRQEWPKNLNRMADFSSAIVIDSAFVK